MIKPFRMVCIGLAAFGLFACEQSDKPSAPSVAGEGTGSARIKLPSLPQGYVPDSSLDSSGMAVFQLTITGPGMEPIRESWYLTPGHTDPVIVGEIPVGWPRTFTGRLIWMSGWSDSTVTHEGMDTVAISRDTVAEVSLYLRKRGSRGAAEVCVQVEGWPADSGCIKRPKYPFLDASGCWRLSVRTAIGGRDSLVGGTLKITQRDSNIVGAISWDSGREEIATGGVYAASTGLVLLGRNSEQSYYIKAYFDSTGRGLEGEYRDSGMAASIGLRAVRILCDTMVAPPLDTICCRPPRPDTLPPPVIDTTLDTASLACWRVHQTLVSGEEMSGSLWLIRRGSALKGSFLWNGFPGMILSSEHVPAGSDGIYLFGMLPAGMGGDTANWAHYKARISVSRADTLEYGAIYARPAGRDSASGEFTGADFFGEWGGTPIQCPERARNWFLMSSSP